MKTTKKLTVLLTSSLLSFFGIGQGAIQGLQNSNFSEEIPSCGSHKLLQHVHHGQHDLLTLSNQLMEQIAHIAQNQESRNYENLLVIPVVFHVVHNNDQENLADSVILNQLEILNDAFRRHNENASQTRPVFLDFVADTKIEFRLAELDPNGNPSSGITRTQTDITHFGGILPFNANQTNEINTWVNDSLFYNWFRLTKTDLGGIDAWDVNRYINIWIGDLRIFEPLINNFEELVFIGLATPPMDHPNWPAEITEPFADFEQGVIMHYVALGDNNPNSFPNPYQNLNSPIKRGKVLIHEVGHYLGLRHIWGDGDCSLDDYITDTPNATNHSNWGCNQNANACVDNINGADLPNMVENYMDYSSGTCQNSFTLGQADLMRSVLEIYRPTLAEIISTVNLDYDQHLEHIAIAPNPFDEEIRLNMAPANLTYIVYNLAGIVVKKGITQSEVIQLSGLEQGTYILELSSGGLRIERLKIIKL